MPNVFSSNCTGSPLNRKLNAKYVVFAIKSSLAHHRHSPSLPAFTTSLKIYLFQQYFVQYYILCCTNLEFSLSLSITAFLSLPLRLVFSAGEFSQVLRGSASDDLIVETSYFAAIAGA